MLNRIVACLLLLGLYVLPVHAQDKEVDRLKECGVVLKETLDIPDGIPQELLDKAECVVVFPSVKKFALGIGGSYGRGAITCRSGKDFTGQWSAPAMMALEGGNIGFQLGGQATDFILLIMNERGAESIMGSKVKLGADASAAAGPKGRTATAGTDIAMRAEILSYSRSRGLFAGVSLEGSTLRSDGGANENVYGKKLDARQIVREGAAPPPSAASQFLSLLSTHSPKKK
jgi:lipid-binding SYLF domain-containing protein